MAVASAATLMLSLTLTGAVPPGTTVTTRTQDGGVRVERSMLGSQP